MEHFSKNWEEVIVPLLNLKPNSYDIKAGMHASDVYNPGTIETINKKETNVLPSNESIDIEKLHKFRDLFRSLHATDPGLWQAMCRMILIDYVCFPQYQLPMGCTSLYHEVYRGRQLLINYRNKTHFH